MGNMLLSLLQEEDVSMVFDKTLGPDTAFRPGRATAHEVVDEVRP